MTYQKRWGIKISSHREATAPLHLASSSSSLLSLQVLEGPSLSLKLSDTKVSEPQIRLAKWSGPGVDRGLHGYSPSKRFVPEFYPFVLDYNRISPDVRGKPHSGLQRDFLNNPEVDNP